jgi:hypothetical protein
MTKDDEHDYTHLSTADHAESDLNYVAGLEAHLDEGGTASAQNVRDLIAMVRWNATGLLDRLAALTNAGCSEAMRRFYYASKQYHNTQDWHGEASPEEGKSLHDWFMESLAALPTATHLFAENANKSTEQFAQNANCPDLKGQI